MQEDIQKKLHLYWFGKLQNGISVPSQHSLWYQSDPKTDEYITSHYFDLLQQAGNRQLSDWQNTACGSLCLIILIDQFSRNIFRNQKQAFAYDDLALEYCLEGLEKGFDKQLQIAERLFYYHPLMHAESLSCQQLCVDLMQQMLVGCNQGNLVTIENSIKFALQHRDIIAEFGRFPYRNQVLERESTASELNYVRSGGQSFGQ